MSTGGLHTHPHKVGDIVSTACVLFSPASTETLGVFVKTPFKIFSKTKGKEGF